MFPYRQDDPQRNLKEQLCGQCLTLNGPRSEHCHSCGHKQLVRVHVPDMTKEESRQGQKRLVIKRNCPHCLIRPRQTSSTRLASILSCCFNCCCNRRLGVPP